MTGSGVFISEGFPVVTARKLREAAMDAQGTGPQHMALDHELTLGNARALAGFGMMKFGLGK